MRTKANEFLDRKASGALIFPVEPMRQNERIIAQQGMFLFPCDSARTFMQNLACLYSDMDSGSFTDESKARMFNNEEFGNGKLGQFKVVKMILPIEQRREALDDLHKMNISEATLFPGLDGFARSLGRYSFRE